MDNKHFEGKALFAFIGVGLLFVIMIILQPLPQEAAMGNLVAVDKLLDQVIVSDASKLENASRELNKLKLSTSSQKQLEAAIKAISDAEISLEGDRARLSGTTNEIKNQIDQAQKALATPGFLERIKSVKDEILAVLWPVLAVMLVWYLLHSKAAITFFRQLGTVFSNLKMPGGLEIGFATAIKSSQEEVLSDYRKQVISKYDGLSAQYQIAETLSRIVSGPIKNFFETAGIKDPHFRCTVHVRDILFDNSLYQLTNYIGREKGGKGRAWSIRRGMIGRTWRLEESYKKGQIPITQRELIETWGLTRDETEGITQIQTMLCYLIKGQNQSPLAMLYLDATEKDAFGNDAQMDKLLETIDAEVKKLALDKSLEQVWQQAQSSAPLIEIYADRK
ncbi:MAG TPA: hypothetical protein VKZ53_06075 [Candidatus Angelobacter sp.]|nr:hypothetical protein [Candidatus Angelobacter sp.]